MIEEIGVITAVDDDHIWVETEIKTTCGSCVANDNCGTSVVAKAFAAKSEQLILRCNEQATVGQKVKLGIPEENLLTASMLMYMLPLAVLIISASLAHLLLPYSGLDSELWIVLVSFLCTFISFRWIKGYLSNGIEGNYHPKLLSLLPIEAGAIPIKQLR